MRGLLRAGLRGLILALASGASCGGRSVGQDERGVGDVAEIALEGGSSTILVRALEAPSAHGLFPSFAATADGSVVLVWTEELDGGQGREHRLRSAVWDGGTFEEARTLMSGEGWFVNWADVPAVARDARGRFDVTWLERWSDRPGAYRARYSRLGTGKVSSGDRWVAPHEAPRTSPAVDLASDAEGPEYGFVSLVARADGGTQAVWLDGRAARAAHHGSMSLRTRTILPDGTLGLEQLLDERVCDCCNTAAIRLGEGEMLVAYRDRDEDEVRDISLVRGRLGPDPVWSEPETVRADGWRIEGCPVNGPALTAWGERVALAWFTAPDGESQVWVAMSEDGGESFDDALRIDEGRAMGRVDVAFLAQEVLLVSWLENEGETSTWRVRALTGAGRELELGETADLASVSGERNDGFLRMRRARGRVLAAWTDGRTSELRVVSLEAGDAGVSSDRPR